MTNVESRMCPRCGHDTTMTLMDIAEDDRKEYLRCILAGRPFQKEYKLFDGKIKLNFKTLPTKISEKLAHVVGDFSDTNVEKASEILKLKLLFYLVNFNDAPYPETGITEESSVETLKAEYVKRFGEFNEELVGILLRVLLEFLKLVRALASSGLDENFWKGAGLV